MRPEYVSIEAISEEESGRRVARGCGIGGSLVVRDACERTSKSYHGQSWPVASNRVLCRRVLNRCTGSVTWVTEQYHPNVDGIEKRQARAGRKRRRLGQRRVFSLGLVVSPLDRRPGNRKILAPPVSPESATCVPSREAERSRLSLTTTAGRRCLTDTFRERSTMSAIE